MRNQVIKQLKTLQDIEFRNFSAKLLPDNEYTLLGVRLPELRKIAKTLLKSDYIGYLNEVGTEYFEEVMLEGFILAGIQEPFNNKKNRIKQFLPKISNWSICDSFVITIKDNSECYYQFCKQCLKSKNPYTKRFALVSFLFYFLNDEHIDEILHLITTLDHPHYYVKMAIAWCLAESMVCYPEKTILAMQAMKDDWTYNKAIQKSRESLRISNKQKEHLNSIKRSK